MDWLLTFLCDTFSCEWRMAVVFFVGAFMASAANWAIYSWAWSPRPISPWSPAPSGQPARGWADRLPIVGWLRMRRESSLHGRWFWVRPLLIELFSGIALAALYWWEVDQLGLIRGQFSSAVGATPVPSWILHAAFGSHMVLFWLMTVATFIDIDEKIIPDEVTVLGTLLGLSIAALVPMSLLPQVTERVVAPLVGVPLAIAAPGHAAPECFVEPVTATAPNAWPAGLAGAPNWQSLAIGLGCYWLWCFALAPRIWRGTRGTLVALRMIAARVAREFCRPPLLVILLAGTLAIGTVWWWGGGAWVGLLTALIGLVGSGGMVWAVRIVGSAALGREAMGFGDVTLMMMMGTFLGWQAGLLIFFLAPLAGIVVGVLQLVLRQDDVIPYGPFLCLAAAAMVVAWADVWNWAQPFFAIGGLVPTALIVCLALLGGLLAIWAQIKKLLFG